MQVSEGTFGVDLSRMRILLFRVKDRRILFLQHERFALAEVLSGWTRSLSALLPFFNLFLVDSGWKRDVGARRLSMLLLIFLCSIVPPLQLLAIACVVKLTQALALDEIGRCKPI